ERSPVEGDRLREVAANGRQLRETAERQTGSLFVAELLLDLERPRVPRVCGLDVARDGVNDPINRGGEAVGPDEPVVTAPLDCIAPQRERDFEIEPDHRDGPEKGGHAALA